MILSGVNHFDKPFNIEIAAGGKLPVAQRDSGSRPVFKNFQIASATGADFEKSGLSPLSSTSLGALNGTLHFFICNFLLKSHFSVDYFNKYDNGAQKKAPGA
jgi:hypothetical protein